MIRADACRGSRRGYGFPRHSAHKSGASYRGSAPEPSGQRVPALCVRVPGARVVLRQDRTGVRRPAGRGRVNPGQYTRRCDRHHRAPPPTRSGLEPFAQAFFGLFLGEVSAVADVTSSTADLLEDVEVILDVLDRTVIRQTV